MYEQLENGANRDARLLTAFISLLILGTSSIVETELFKMLYERHVGKKVTEKLIFFTLCGQPAIPSVPSVLKTPQLINSTGLSRPHC